MPRLFAVVWLPLGVYGALNVLTPATTIRWQNRATSRRTEGDPRRAVGLAFQRLVGQSSSADSVHERAVRTRVRLVGLAEITIAAVVIALVVHSA